MIWPYTHFLYMVRYNLTLPFHLFKNVKIMPSAQKQDLITLINNIPHGRVASYGVLATILNTTKNTSLTWRTVWRLLTSMPQSERDILPWRRVINKKGYISSRILWTKWLLQEQKLVEEWIEVNDGFVDMSVYWWGE